MTLYGHIISRAAAVTGFIAVTLLLACSCKGGTAAGGKKTATAASKAETERFWPYFDGTYPMVVTDDKARIEYFSSPYYHIHFSTLTVTPDLNRNSR